MARRFKSRRTASFLATLAFVCFGAGIAYAECGDPWNPPYNPPAPSVAPASVSAGGEIVISATGLTGYGPYYAYVYGTGTYWNSTPLQHAQIVPDAYGDIAPFGATIPSNIPPGSYYVYLYNWVEATNSALIDVTAAAAPIQGSIEFDAGGPVIEHMEFSGELTGSNLTPDTTYDVSYKTDGSPLVTKGGTFTTDGSGNFVGQLEVFETGGAGTLEIWADPTPTVEGDETSLIVTVVSQLDAFGPVVFDDLWTEVEEFPSANNGQVPLRRGIQRSSHSGWGQRHIEAERGWNEVRAKTMDTLANPDPGGFTETEGTATYDKDGWRVVVQVAKTDSQGKMQGIITSRPTPSGP